MENRKLKILEARSLPQTQARRESAKGELAARRAELQRGAGMALLLDELSRLDSGNTLIKRKLRETLDRWGIKPEGLADDKLETAYWELTGFLRLHFSKSESVVTPFEKKFVSYFRTYSKLDIHSDFWISNFQLDAVVPGVSQGKSVGIAYELDGPIHDREGKIKKDSYKSEFLKQHFKTPIHSIQNHSLTYQEVQKIADSLQAQRRTDSRKLRAWWRKVFIYTLAFGGQRANSEYANAIVQNLLGLRDDQIRELLEVVKAKRTGRFVNGQLGVEP